MYSPTCFPFIFIIKDNERVIEKYLCDPSKEVCKVLIIVTFVYLLFAIHVIMTFYWIPTLINGKQN